jgi:hypothetical protein
VAALRHNNHQLVFVQQLITLLAEKCFYIRD